MVIFHSYVKLPEGSTGPFRMTKPSHDGKPFPEDPSIHPPQKIVAEIPGSPWADLADLGRWVIWQEPSEHCSTIVPFSWPS